MAKITIEELSESLKNYLDGLGLTETQVQELIDKFEDEKIGNINNLETENKTIVEAINEVFHSGNNVKQDLVAALLAKGVEATIDISFNKIFDILNMLINPNGTATVSDVLNGITFINSNGVKTGTMTNKGNETVTPGASAKSLAAGYYSEIIIKGGKNIVSPSSILSGVTIFGVKGTL